MSSPDPVTRWAAPFLGGPRGTRLREGSGDGVVGYLVLGALGLSLFLGLVLQSQCVPTGWSGAEAYARMCGSSIAAGYFDPFTLSLAGGGPAAIGAALRLVSEDVATYVGFASLVNVMAFAAAGIALVRLTPARWWLLLFALSPVVFLGWLQAFDVVGVALVLWALVLWREKAALSTVDLALVGLFFALAAQFSPYALVVLLGVAIHAALGQGRRSLPDLLVLLGIFAVVTGLLLLIDGRAPARLAAWFGLDAGLSGTATGPESLNTGSVAAIVQALGAAMSPGIFALLGLILTVLGAAAVAYLARQATREGKSVNLWALIALLLTIALVLSPSLELPHVLWLLPFAVLAVRDSRVHLPWMVIEAATAIAVSLYLMGLVEPAEGETIRALPIGFMMPLVAIRLMALLVVGYFAATRLTGPEEPEPEEPSPDTNPATHVAATQPLAAATPTAESRGHDASTAITPGAGASPTDTQAADTPAADASPADTEALDAPAPRTRREARGR